MNSFAVHPFDELRNFGGSAIKKKKRKNKPGHYQGRAAPHANFFWAEKWDVLIAQLVSSRNRPEKNV